MPSPSGNHSLPEDYLERVYAGVLGKLISVYVGRPFEGWSHQRITQELGHIRYYVHYKFDSPLVITDDDDVSGTFHLSAPLEEHRASEDLTSREIGQTWLNSVIENKTVFWWGGRGISTEHTAFLNLRNGIPAPLSGAIETNGQTVAEQIGAQIFIDGWAMTCPGNPRLAAAKLARAAGRVSHDGESVYAAQLWAAMEAQAFLTKDVDVLLDTGLSMIPENSLVARVICKVRQWAKEDGNWLATRQRIEDDYGYHKFHGVCHAIPNQAIMVMALLYGGHSFDEAVHIINTCGWDTDCNSGNVACLVAIMHGLSAFDGLDWRGPLADRALISGADGGYSINNAARISLDLANMGHRLAGLAPFVQGFRPSPSDGAVSVRQGLDEAGKPGLVITARNLGGKGSEVEVSTETFTPKSIVQMRTYELMASPLLYPGQTVRVAFSCSSKASGRALVRLRLRVYTNSDELRAVDGPATTISAGQSAGLFWTIPDDMESQPIQSIGLLLHSARDDDAFDGTIWLDKLHWQGAPTLTIRRPESRKCDFWYRSWVNGVDTLHRWMASSLGIAQSRGEGILIYGTRDWDNYRVYVPKFKVNLGSPAGVAARVQGLNRYYCVVFVRGNRIALVKAIDGERITMTSAPFQWNLDEEHDVTLTVRGEAIEAQVGDATLTAADPQYATGGIGLIVADGSVSVDEVRVGAL